MLRAPPNRNHKVASAKTGNLFSERVGVNGPVKRSTFFTPLMAVMLGQSSASAQEAPFVRDVFGRINVQRKQHRLSTLTDSKTLERAAQAHAEWMARNRKMEHFQDPPAGHDVPPSAEPVFK